MEIWDLELPSTHKIFLGGRGWRLQPALSPKSALSRLQKIKFYANHFQN